MIWFGQETHRFEWHHLVDLCALPGALRIDDDAIYDPKLLNDRLLLGLKGTMSEFELGLMRQRARQAYLQTFGAIPSSGKGSRFSCRITTEVIAYAQCNLMSSACAS